MKNIQIIELEKYKDPLKYKFIEEGIYQILFNEKDKISENGDYVGAFSFTLEEGENLQNPLEDILDKFYIYISEFIQYETNNSIMQLELSSEDDLDYMKQFKTILGKRVYNEEYKNNVDGKTCLRLVIKDR